MELALFGTGFHHTFNLPVAPGQPLIIRASNSELTTDSTSLLSQSLHDPLNISAKPPKTSLISSPERQSAVLDIQQSIDLVSALARFSLSLSYRLSLSFPAIVKQVARTCLEDILFSYYFQTRFCTHIVCLQLMLSVIHEVLGLLFVVLMRLFKLYLVLHFAGNLIY